MEQIFNRESLYAEVWAEPITKLAKKYNLSDNGLRKVCITLEIPLPVRGHWARIAAGQIIEPTPLLTTIKSTQFISRQPPPPEPVEDQETKWLTQRLAFEADSANIISVGDVLISPHRLVLSAQKIVKSTIAELEKQRKIKENPPKKRAIGFDALSSWNWNTYISHGYMEIREETLPLRVSIEAADRSLRLWDAVIKAAELRGFKVQILGGRLQVEYDGLVVDLRIAEKIKKVEISKSGMSSFNILMKEHIKNKATGELRIFVGYIATETKFEDEPGEPLEVQLNKVFRKIYKALVAVKANDVRNKKWAEKYKLEEERREVERQSRQERERLKTLEVIEQSKLAEEASAWQQAEIIRNYVAHLRETSPRVTAEMAEWLKSAAKIADRIDPTLNRLESTKG